MSTEFMNRLAENLSKFLGKDCEIAIHDFSDGHDATIVNIFNGHVSGRTVGCPPTNLFFEKLSQEQDHLSDLPIYFTKLPDGRTIKSCTTFINDDNGTPIGALCINMDISDYTLLYKKTCEILDQQVLEHQESEVYAQSLSDIMEHHLKTVEEIIGKPASEMKKQEKLKALAYLDRRGVFQIVKANVRLCEFFSISKFTLYNYLEEIRSESYSNNS